MKNLFHNCMNTYSSLQFKAITWGSKNTYIPRIVSFLFGECNKATLSHGMSLNGYQVTLDRVLTTLMTLECLTKDNCSLLCPQL